MLPTQRSWSDALLLIIKGMAMGMANKIPGVSGGIIALAAGFYEELIYSFSRIDAKAFKILFRQGFFVFYKHINASFLLLLFSGVGLSFFSVSLLLDYLLRQYPQQVLGAFFGMIITSVYYIWKDLPQYSNKEYISGIVGTILGLALLWINPGTENDHWLFVIFCGMVSISGMTLPGLSGSLLILILGNYNLLLVDCVNAVFFTLQDIFTGQGWGLDDPERKRLLGVFLFFTLGSSIGLVVFSKLLERLIKDYKSITISTLVGFILGSLGAVWPWTTKTIALEKINFTLATTAHNTFFFPNLASFSTQSTLFFILLGIGIVILLEHYGNKQKT
jgi:uncharacterized membrane protein